MQASVIDAEGRLTDDPHTMSKYFAASFETFSIRSLPSNNSPHQQFQGQFTDLVVVPESVTKLLQDPDPNYNMGFNGVRPRFLKSQSAEPSLLLAITFSSSLFSGILPDEWLS